MEDINKKEEDIKDNSLPINNEVSKLDSAFEIKYGFEHFTESISNLARIYLENEKESNKNNLDLEKHQLSVFKLNVILKFTLLSLSVILAVVCYLIKDLPPALNSLICFVAGFAVNGFSASVVKKRDKGNTSES